MGKMLLNGATVKRISGKTEVVQVCRFECFRVQALETWFGMLLAEASGRSPRRSRRKGELMLCQRRTGIVSDTTE